MNGAVPARSAVMTTPGPVHGREVVSGDVLHRGALVDGKRIRQFTADLVALSRAFQPIGFWFTPAWYEDFPLIVTPDTPNGVSTSVMVEVLLGDDAGYEAWGNEILDWGARQTLTTDMATGRTAITKTPCQRTRHGSTTWPAFVLRWVWRSSSAT